MLGSEHRPTEQTAQGLCSPSLVGLVVIPHRAYEIARKLGAVREETQGSEAPYPVRASSVIVVLELVEAQGQAVSQALVLVGGVQRCFEFEAVHASHQAVVQFLDRRVDPPEVLERPDTEMEGERVALHFLHQRPQRALPFLQQSVELRR